MVVVWSARAQRELAAIWDYYSAKSIPAAVKIVRTIHSAVHKLANFPEIAPVELWLEEFPEGFRSFVVQKIHKIIYFIKDDKIYIVALFDCRRNPATLHL